MDFNNADYDSINSNLLRVDWNTLLCDTNIDNCVKKFYKCVKTEIDSNVPLKVLNNKNSSYPHWYSGDVIVNIIKKKKLHQIAVLSGLTCDEIDFKRHRAKCI